jgi:hypothetical protein
LFKKFDQCRVCKSRLIDGPEVERRAEGKGFTCEITGIPTKVCPQGCQGNYWYDLDFGVEVMDCLDSPRIAKRRLTLFSTRSYCRECNIELQDSEDVATFHFECQLHKGSTLMMKIIAPALTCPRCHSTFMPAQSSSHDPYYSGLADVIGQTITTDLIYK